MDELTKLKIQRDYLYDVVFNTLLDEYEIKSLLQLVHPDKHNNSELSIKMTTRLLEYKKYYNYLISEFK